MKEQNAKVSIIIPVYNVEKYVSRCLESVLKQTYDNIEIICVDDCGTDDSMNLVERYSHNYPDKIVIVRNPENKGLGGARDAGIVASTGKYLMFVDSDDYVDKRYVEKYLDAMAEKHVDIVMGGYIRNRGGKYKTTIPGKTKEDIWLFCSACGKLYRKEFLADHSIDFRCIRRYEDELFLYRTLLNNARVKVIDYAGYYYYLNTESITQSRNQDRTGLFVEYAENINSFYQEVKNQVQSADSEIFIYCLMARLTACLLFNARGCGTTRMKELYKIYNRIMDRIVGDKMANSYVSIRKRIHAEDIKVHYAMWLVALFRRMRMDWLLFALDSHL